MKSRRKQKNRAAQKEHEENKRILAEHVEFIFGVIERARRRTIEDIIVVGERLIDAQSRLDHGEWAGWLEKNFGWSDSTALNLMNVYRLVKSAEYESLNFKELSITISELYALARPSTPKEVKAKIIGRAKAGEYIGVGSVDDAKAALQPPPTETAKPQEEAPQTTSSEVDGHEAPSVVADEESDREEVTETETEDEDWRVRDTRAWWVEVAKLALDFLKKYGDSEKFIEPVVLRQALPVVQDLNRQTFALRKVGRALITIADAVDSAFDDPTSDDETAGDASSDEAAPSDAPSEGAPSDATPEE